MKNTRKIKKNFEFKIVLKRGKAYGGKNIIIYIYPNNKPFNRMGIGVSKKYGKAVQRNKIKRLIRENYKNIEQNLNGNYNFLIMVKNDAEASKVDFYSIKNDFDTILRKAGCMEWKNIL